MGDAPTRTELNPPHAKQGEGDHAQHGGGGAAQLQVTTGPIRGSRKIHIGALGVAMRAVDLEPSSGEPPVVLYDTSGPYTDPAQPHRHHGRAARAPPRLDPRPRRR